MNVSSGQNVGSVTSICEHWEQVLISALHGNVSGRNSMFREINLTDETRGYNPAEVSEIQVLETRFDPQLLTHHNNQFDILSMLKTNYACHEKSKDPLQNLSAISNWNVFREPHTLKTVLISI